MTQPPDLLPCQLPEMFIYDACTGEIFWKIAKQRTKIGQRAGTIVSNGRRRVEINGRTYSTASIVFAIHNGRWPVKQVDHIDQNKTNDRIENLREATNQENSRNRPGRAKSGYKGVSLHKGKFIARIGHNGKVINLGSFDNPEDAHIAYCEAAEKYHGEFKCQN